MDYISAISEAYKNLNHLGEYISTQEHRMFMFEEFEDFATCYVLPRFMEDYEDGLSFMENLKNHLQYSNSEELESVLKEILQMHGKAVMNASIYKTLPEEMSDFCRAGMESRLEVLIGCAFYRIVVKTIKET